MTIKALPIVLLMAAISAPVLVAADDDDDELEFDQAYLYFELNDTDGDLGIHGEIDGDAWKRVAIEGPDDRKILRVMTRSKLRRQGLTELFFESAEPCFPSDAECEDPLDPAVFFSRFPEGEYEWEGKTLDNEEIEGEVFLSHRIPAAPVVFSVGEEIAPAGDECWDPGDVDDVVIDWDPVTRTHVSLGFDTDAPLGDNSVIYYEFVVEIDDTDYKTTALVPPDVTEWTVPEAFVELAEGLMVEDEDTGMEVAVEEIKFEIIVRVETGEFEGDEGEIIESKPGNQSAVESCFEI